MEELNKEQTKEQPIPTNENTNQELEQLRAENEKYKSAINNLTKENADYKRKYNEKLSDEEKSRAAQEELEKHYKDIERENTLYKYQVKLSASVSDVETRNAIAELFTDGKNIEAINKLNEWQSKVMEDAKKSWEQQALTNNPTPPPQDDRPQKVDFGKLSYKELTKLKAEQPELFKKD